MAGTSRWGEHEFEEARDKHEGGGGWRRPAEEEDPVARWRWPATRRSRQGRRWVEAVDRRSAVTQAGYFCVQRHELTRGASAEGVYSHGLWGGHRRGHGSHCARAEDRKWLVRLGMSKLKEFLDFPFSLITNFEGCRVLVAKPFLSSRVIVHDGPLRGNVDIHSNTFSFDVILLELISGRASLSKALLIAPSHDINNLAGEEAVGNVDDDMGSLDPGIIDSDDFTVDKSSVEREGYEEVKLEKDHAAEEMKALKAKMVALNDALKADALKAVDIEMEEMESSVKNNAQAMQQMVNAPW
ncbi:hypothetical protein ACQ4PT_054076 [Festuca glaucescens]